ncbi:Cytochrome P450 CYP6 [Frankliniella occidentalis]|uniref:Cytochrome P450 6k1-like n=1 Tax=Frankliniella occidentalis TaxID=133901 RepID=A0A6J1SJ06_FRAOC|nr:cytochrome P450 6k1-like [Frankliniella occidentalis]KAE8748379.1 Cytochrome P450 CYP6 [Frankliniella occidentalis]
MLALYLSCGAVALCAALYVYMRRSLTYWQRRKVPVVTPTTLFGNYGPSILGKRSLSEVAQDIYNEHKDERYVGTYFMLTPLLQINDPDIIRSVFIKDFQDFNGRGMHSQPSYDPLSAHLFILAGQPWRNMRVKLSPTFTTGKIKYMFDTISECANHLREHVDSSVAAGGGRYVENVRELVARFSTDIISSVAFGIESNSMKNPDSEFRQMGHRIFESCLDVNLRHLLLFFGGDVMKTFSIRCVPAAVHNFFTRIVDEMIDYREKNGVERADMLNLLIKLKNEGFLPPDSNDTAEEKNRHSDVNESNGTEARLTKLSGKDIAAQVFVFFVAGFETTSTTTSFTLYELAKHPDIQDKVVAEMDAALAKHGGKVTYDTIMDLPYTDMCVQETLRMYPPVPFLTRQAMVKRQLPLSDVVLEKGTRLMIPVRALHYDPQYWDEPLRYDPQRFTEEAKKARPQLVYMPFGDGPRICIGMRLGLVQVKMALLTILTRARVAVAPDMPKEVTLDPRCILPSPVHGCRLVLSARK